MAIKGVKGVEEIKEAENHKFIKWFSELSNKDVAVAGGKGASLAEMYNHGFPIPPGFIITAQAYIYFIEKAGLKDEIKKILEMFDVENTELLEKNAKIIREMIANAKMPKEIEGAIIEAYDILDIDKKNLEKAKGTALDILKTGHEPPFVAVRSSATTEDLLTASFAGQQETFLNVKGAKELMQKVKECFASLFTARAIYYRAKKGFYHEQSYLAVVVQKMIDSEKSGVMFSKNPVKDDNNVLIEAVFGLGEGIVSGRVKPDSYLLNRELEILDVKISEKKEAIIRDSSGRNKIIELKKEKARQQVLSNYEIKRLAQYALELEEHYKKPQDIEFAIAGEKIYIVQSRPITTKAKESGEITAGKILLSGLAASPGIASGVVRIIHSLTELPKIKKGDVLVTRMTNPDMVVSMQKASAIVTDEGGVTSHAAIVSREMGIPAVVGTTNATTMLKDNEVVTIDGNSGKIFEGKLTTKVIEIKPIVPTKIKIKVIVDLPDYAERAARTKAAGVGLTRIEGIIASSGKHPVAYEKENKLKEYTAMLYSGLKKISEHFNEIWIRTSDIRSDEYRNLEGAPEEIEGNPMLGFHGIRFSLKHENILKAELNAINALASEFPKKKFGIMMPQIISVDELKKTKQLAKQLNTPRNVIIGIMVETPAAVMLIDELCKEGIAFASFGTNDLTQYTLAIDRNNESVQYLYNELHPAVLNSIKHVIEICKKYDVETSICGQAGSNEEMVKFLVKQGIDSISVNADSAEKISKLVAGLEGQLRNLKHAEQPAHEQPSQQLNQQLTKKIPKQKREITTINNLTPARDTTSARDSGHDNLANSEDIESIVLKQLDTGFDEEAPAVQVIDNSSNELNDKNKLAEEGLADELAVLAKAGSGLVASDNSIGNMGEELNGKSGQDSELVNEVADDEVSDDEELAEDEEYNVELPIEFPWDNQVRNEQLIGDSGDKKESSKDSDDINDDIDSLDDIELGEVLNSGAEESYAADEKLADEGVEDNNGNKSSGDKAGDGDNGNEVMDIF